MRRCRWGCIANVVASINTVIGAKCVPCPSGITDGLRGKRSGHCFWCNSSFFSALTFLPEGVDLGSCKFVCALIRVKIYEKLSEKKCFFCQNCQNCLKWQMARTFIRKLCGGSNFDGGVKICGRSKGGGDLGFFRAQKRERGPALAWAIPFSSFLLLFSDFFLT